MKLSHLRKNGWFLYPVQWLMKNWSINFIIGLIFLRLPGLAWFTQAEIRGVTASSAKHYSLAQSPNKRDLHAAASEAGYEWAWIFNPARRHGVDTPAQANRSLWPGLYCSGLPMQDWDRSICAECSSHSHHYLVLPENSHGKSIPSTPQLWSVEMPSLVTRRDGGFGEGVFIMPCKEQTS